MNEPLRYSNVMSNSMFNRYLCQHMLKEVDRAFWLGTVSGSGMGLLTELSKAEKSFLTEHFMKCFENFK